jgi:hypothetical protein
MITKVQTVTQTLASAVATSGTFTVTYPANTDAATFQNGCQHTIAALGKVFTNPVDFGITSFDNTTCTVTWRNALTLPAGTVVRVGLDSPGITSYRDDPAVWPAMSGPQNIQPMFPVRVSLGAPDALDADGIVTVGTLTASGTQTLNGAIVTNGVAVLDVARNITVGGGQPLNSTVFTVRGTDIFGVSLTEAITGQATTTATKGAKAFKTVSSIVLSGTSLSNSAIASNTIGFGDVLGLPVYLPATGDAFLKGQLTSNSVPTTGTFVAGLSPNTASTATTADVRGTVTPNDATNGTRAYELILLLSDPAYRGPAQFNS